MSPDKAARVQVLGGPSPERLHRGCWRPLGMRLRWRAADRPLAHAASSVLATVAKGPPAGIDADLLLLRSRDVDAAPGLGAFYTAPDGHAYREAAGMGAILTASGSLSVADLSGAMVVAWISPSADLESEAEALLGAPFWRLAAFRGLVACHAAALRAPDGRALLLRGLGGAGKSTLALAAWKQGWPLISEEVAWLDGRCSGLHPVADRAQAGKEGGSGQDVTRTVVSVAPAGRSDALHPMGRWLVRGRPDSLHLDREAAAANGIADLLPDGRHSLWPDATSTRGRPQPRKVRIDLQRWPQRLCGAAPFGGLVFLCRDEPALRGRWLRCGREEALARWQATAIAGESSQAGSLVQAAAEAVTGEGAYLLGDGTPTELVDRLGEVAADHRRHT